jgi:predicted transcriptional regulator
MDQAETPRRAPQAWLDAIARGEADVAAGRTLDLEEVMGEFDAEDAALDAQANARVTRTSRRTASE